VDTRTKILTQELARAAAAECRAAGKAVTLVTGFFDPLVAAHPRRLEELARAGAALFVSIQDPPHPLLPARARAELVAALRVVDYVMLGGAIAADAVFHEEDADRLRTQELTKHVRERQEGT
jgi:bifunctional ADP-heptose synthase (sugar kinase/adenylyltransferase)